MSETLQHPPSYLSLAAAYTKSTIIPLAAAVLFGFAAFIVLFDLVVYALVFFHLYVHEIFLLETVAHDLGYTVEGLVGYYWYLDTLIWAGIAAFASIVFLKFKGGESA